MIAGSAASLVECAGSFSADEGDHLFRCHDGYACSAVYGEMAHVPGHQDINSTLSRHLKERLVIRIWQAMGQGTRRD
jgi:hypothetical protein